VLQAFVVTFREGIEAFLIVAISLSYLRKTGRERLRAPVYWGIACSVLTSAAAGYLFSLASNQAFWEGTLAVLASVLVCTLVVHMWRSARTLRSRIHNRLEQATQASSARMACVGVFLFILLMITREGMEAALLLGTLLFQVKTPQLALGAFLGLLAAGGIALLWGRYGHRVNLPRFLQVTAVFLLVFVLQLLIYGMHELAEANVLPNSLAIHDATEPYGPDGNYGKWLSFALVAVPLVWLVLSWVSDKSRARRHPGAVPEMAAPSAK